jgi:hypothetical protein
MPRADDEDVERIARAFYEADRISYGGRVYEWTQLLDVTRDYRRAIVRLLLETKVIRVGERPEKLRAQIEGQTSLYDVLGES